MHLTEQSNVVKSTTAAYSQKYQLCNAGLSSNWTSDLFNTYCCIRNLK